jgi:hypothetical protein
MGDNLSSLPQFPGEESRRYEERFRPQDLPPDRIIERLRHAWPTYLIFVGLPLGYIVLVVVFAVARQDWEILYYLMLAPVVFAIRIVVWWCRNQDR